MTMSLYALNTPRPTSGQPPMTQALGRDDTLASIDQLNALRQIIYRHYDDILQALRQDQPQRNRTDLELSEIVVTLQRINLVILSLKSGLQTPYTSALDTAIQLQKNVKRINADDNAPFRSVFMPLINIIAAGKSAILHLSPHASATRRFITQIIDATFTPDEVMIWQDDIETPLIAMLADNCNSGITPLKANLGMYTD
jgi:hypothetical protein